MLSASIIPGVYAGKSWAQASMRDLELCGGKGAEHGGRGCGRGFELGLRCLWPWFGLKGCYQVFSGLCSRHNFPVTHIAVVDRRWAASFRVQLPATMFSTLLRSSVALSGGPSSALLQAWSSTTIFPDLSRRPCSAFLPSALSTTIFATFPLFPLIDRIIYCILHTRQI